MRLVQFYRRQASLLARIAANTAHNETKLELLGLARRFQALADYRAEHVAEPALETSPRDDDNA